MVLSSISIYLLTVWKGRVGRDSLCMCVRERECERERESVREGEGERERESRLPNPLISPRMQIPCAHLLNIALLQSNCLGNVHWTEGSILPAWIGSAQGISGMFSSNLRLTSAAKGTETSGEGARTWMLELITANYNYKELQRASHAAAGAPQMRPVREIMLLCWKVWGHGAKCHLCWCCFCALFCLVLFFVFLFVFL